MSARPRLKPHLRPLRRGATGVQFGLDPGPGAVVLTGLTPPEADLVLALDGTRDRRQLHAAAIARGVEPARLDTLIETLHRHRLLVPGTIDRAHLSALPHPSLRTDLTVDAHAVGMVYADGVDGLHHIGARAHQCVIVDGVGPVPAAVASALRAGGVGSVLLGREALDHTDLDLRTYSRAPQTKPDLVVLTGVGLVHPARGEPWFRRSVAHLPVVVEPQRVVVGPLMGITADQPCLRCQHLFRTERDRVWPTLAAQAYPDELRAEPVTTTETSLLHLVAGTVAMVAFTYLAGQPTPSGVAVEMSLPWPETVHRQWRRHPDCPVHATAPGSAPALPADEATPPGQPQGSGQATMAG